MISLDLLSVRPGRLASESGARTETPTNKKASREFEKTTCRSGRRTHVLRTRFFSAKYANPNS